MVIWRVIDDKKYKFELSKTELAMAYYEQEYLYDMEDVLNLIEGMGTEDVQSDYGVSKEEFISLAPKIACQMRSFIDANPEGPWFDAREDAVWYVIDDYKSNLCTEDVDRDPQE